MITMVVRSHQVPTDTTKDSRIGLFILPVLTLGEPRLNEANKAAMASLASACSPGAQGGHRSAASV